MDLADFATAKEEHWLDEVMLCTAHSTSIIDLTPDEQQFHDAVIAALTNEAK